MRETTIAEASAEADVIMILLPETPIEQVGGVLRETMPWISEGKTSVQDASGGQG